MIENEVTGTTMGTQTNNPVAAEFDTCHATDQNNIATNNR